VCLRYSIPGNGEHAASCIWVREQGKRRPKRNDFMIGPPWAAQSGCAQARGRFQPHREFSRYCFPEATGNGVARLLPSWTEGKYTRLSFTGSLFEQQCWWCWQILLDLLQRFGPRTVDIIVVNDVKQQRLQSTIFRSATTTIQ
jgi:hypothetical protein